MTTGVFAKSAAIAVGGLDPAFPKGQGYGALVGDIWVRLAPNAQQDVRIYTRDSLAQRSDDDGSVYNNVLDIGYAWTRSDVSGGEGLDYDPRLLSVAEGAAVIDQLRFWESENIDIRRPLRGEPYTFQLSTVPELWLNEPTLIDLTTSDTYLYVARNDFVDRYSDWDAPADFSDQAGSVIVQIEASSTGEVAVLLDDGTVEMFTPQTPTYTPVPGIANAVSIWFAKGRFIVLIDNPGDESWSLAEFYPSGIGPIFDTLPGVVYSVVSSGPALVAAVEDGTLRTYVSEQANQQQPDSVNLVLRGRTQVPEGEVPYLLGSNAGVLLVLTRSTREAATNTVRLYQAEVLDARFDYTVGQLALQREWPNAYETIDQRQNMATTRDEIWFSVQEDAAEDSTWRFDLVTLGLTRHRKFPNGASQTHSFVIFDDQGGYIVGTNVYKTSEEYMNEGWLISPNINFGLNTDISWLATTLIAENIASTGKQVELWHSTDPDAIQDPDHHSWILNTRVSAPGQADAETILSQVKSKSLALQVKMYSSESNARTPRVARFAVRGIPVQRDWILELPVNVSDWISAPGRSPVRIPTYGDEIHRHLLNKIGDNVEIVVLDPPFGFRGIIDNILEPVEYITDRGSVSVRAVLQCRGARITSTATATGDFGMGLGTMGITTMGVGQTDRT